MHREQKKAMNQLMIAGIALVLLFGAVYLLPLASVAHTDMPVGRYAITAFDGRYVTYTITSTVDMTYLAANTYSTINMYPSQAQQWAEVVGVVSDANGCQAIGGSTWRGVGYGCWFDTDPGHIYGVGHIPAGVISSSTWKVGACSIPAAKIKAVSGYPAFYNDGTLQELCPQLFEGNGEYTNIGSVSGTIILDTNPQACEPSWSCTAWSDCVEQLQVRVCTDSNSCGTMDGKPAEQQACTPVPEPEPPNILSYMADVVNYIIGWLQGLFGWL